MKTLTLCLIGIVLISGCNTPNIGNNGISEYVTQAKEFTNETLPVSVARLPEMNLSDVNTFEKYKTFADNINSLIDILNRETDLFNIPKLETTTEAWGKASKLITKYGPLINNYNNVVSSAKMYKGDRNDENLEDFYIASGGFALETGVIVWAVFYGAAYNSVGLVYRSVGFNRLAFKCPTCIKIALSNAHWTVRTALVEGSSLLADKVIRQMIDIYEKGDVEALLSHINSAFDSVGNYIGSYNITTQ